jgi:putative membrane protein
MPYYPYGPGPWGWGWAIGGLIMTLAFWGVIVAGVVIAIRAFSGRGAAAWPHTDDALEILRRRYAAGEITKEQFEEMKRTLS